MTFVVDPLHPMTVAPKTAVHVTTVISENSNAWVCHVKMVFVTCFKADAMLWFLLLSHCKKYYEFDTRCFAIFKKKCLFEVNYHCIFFYFCHFLFKSWDMQIHHHVQPCDYLSYWGFVLVLYTGTKSDLSIHKAYPDVAHIWGMISGNFWLCNSVQRMSSVID